MIKQLSLMSRGKSWRNVHQSELPSRDNGGGQQKEPNNDETVVALGKTRSALNQVQAELDALRVKHRKEQESHRLEIAALTHEKSAADERLWTLERKWRDHNCNKSRLEDSYDDLMTDALKEQTTSSSSSSSSSAKQLQSELCKAMNIIDALSEQIAMIKGHSDSLIHKIKADAGKQLEEMCRTEVELMNQMTRLNQEKNDMEELYKVKIHNRERDVEMLERMAAKSALSLPSDDATVELSDSDDGDDSSHDDEKGGKERRIESLEKQIEILRREKTDLWRSLKLKDDKIARLEEDNQIKESAIRSVRQNMDGLSKDTESSEDTD